jgi:hypothetical protein
VENRCGEGGGGGPVEPNSCTNTDILATGENNNDATAEAQGSNEPMDPSSGDSAGGDITSSLIDESIACGKDRRRKSISSNRWCGRAGEKNMRTGEGVSGCRTVSPRRMSAEPCAEETAPRATVMGRSSARRAELPRPKPDRRRRCPELGLGLGERRAGGIEACCGLVTSLVHGRDRRRRRRRRSRRGTRAVAVVGGEERRGEALKDPGSAAAVELLGARLLCALYALLAWERDPPAGALGWGWAMHYGRRATY